MKDKLQVIYRKTAELIPYINNSRTHSDEQIMQVAASIKEFGFTNPVLIDEGGGIIAGHGRLQAANRLGMDEVPTITLSGLSDNQRKAYIIADNKLALNSGWNDKLLALELQELQDNEFDLSLIGFDVDELALLLEPEQVEGLTDEDAVPEVETANVVSVRGDVWVLGHNRVMCGDSTMVDDIERLTLGEKAQLLHADPPYGMGKEATHAETGKTFAEMEGDR